MKKIEKIQKFIEVTIPSIAFVILFVAFIMQIFSRYILNKPITWAYEVTTFCFIWIIFFGALLTRRLNKDIAFTALYDSWTKKKKERSDKVNNLLVVIFYPLVLFYSIKHFIFISYEKSTVLKVPLNLVFFPFLIYIIGVWIYSLKDLLVSIKGQN